MFHAAKANGASDRSQREPYHDESLHGECVMEVGHRNLTERLLQQMVQGLVPQMEGVPQSKPARLFPVSK